MQAENGSLADAGVCGINQSEVCLLGFINEAYCQRLIGEPLPMETLIQRPEVIDAVRTGLKAHNKAHPNAAARIARIVLQPNPPQADAREITEKGYINQNKAQRLRATDVDKLYASSPSSEVIVL